MSSTLPLNRCGLIFYFLKYYICISAYCIIADPGSDESELDSDDDSDEEGFFPEEAKKISKDKKKKKKALPGTVNGYVSLQFHRSRQQQKLCIKMLIFSYLLVLTYHYVLGAQNNCLIETVL